MDLKIGQKWRHKERGSVYEILDPNSRIQCSSIDGSMQRMLEKDIWVSYRDVRGGVAHPTCFRMHSEFLDGRFELVNDGPG